MAAERDNNEGSGPACDQCRSRKVKCDRNKPCSSCQKAGLSCDLSQSKRVNHTKQLDFTAVTSRLDNIEATLANLNNLQQEFVSSSRRASCLQSPAPADSGRPDQVISTEPPSLLSNAQDISNASSSLPLTPVSTVHHDDGRFYGPTAPLSLFNSARDCLEKALHEKGSSSLRAALDSKPDALSALEQRLTKFPFGDLNRDHIERGDGGAVHSPPQRFLESHLNLYLSHFNTYTPIFDETRLKDAIQLHYSGQPLETPEAWSLCFNNIVILGMCVELRLGRQSQTGLHGMQDEILHSFLRNSYRCLGDLDRFSGLSVVNLQALTTLALVVREFHHGSAFGLLLPRICQMARAMGLQQSHSNNVSDTVARSERSNLFWTLYRMDKQRCMMTGQPCDLYLFDSDIQFGTCGSILPMRPLLTAHSHMMSLWEDIYVSLYSKRAFRRGQSQRIEQSRNLEKSFEAWRAENRSIMSDPSTENIPETAIMILELRYCFEVGKTLIYRSFDSATDRQHCVDSSKAALGIIQEAFMLTSKESATGLLGRLFRNYPTAAFFEICSNTIKYNPTEALSTTTLLASTVRALSDLVNPAFSNAYYARLYTGLAWFLDVVRIIQEALEGPANDFAFQDVAGLHTPRSSPSISGQKRKSGSVSRSGSGTEDNEPPTARRKAPEQAGTHLGKSVQPIDPMLEDFLANSPIWNGAFGSRDFATDGLMSTTDFLNTTGVSSNEFSQAAFTTLQAPFSFEATDTGGFDAADGFWSVEFPSTEGPMGQAWGNVGSLTGH
ncbi:hypothetical protein BDV96DRAFT_295048 [Lophiotrema nucula]|uniref:Zn(2)-C6 fungal-type domain-containing protein n=1 Tax=Lophiotrema nucula TaxID=690887 RepID=A0A6A5YL16_9PLEO|nr:hypothetical protein BDV96DRAFT_295048 [Lophiotrema nucula]